MAEVCHNAAISVWILANSYWMLTEFTGVDENVVYGEWTMKHLAVIPFVIGLSLVGYYYLYYQFVHLRHSPVHTAEGLLEGDQNTAVPLG